MSLEFKSFSEARENNLSLKEIKEKVQSFSLEQRWQLSEQINQQVINSLHKGLIIKKWDELNYLKSLTSSWNKIIWDNKYEADNVEPGDKIQIIWTHILKNGKFLWKVEGFVKKDIPLIEFKTLAKAKSPKKVESNKTNEKSKDKETQEAQTTTQEEIKKVKADLSVSESNKVNTAEAFSQKEIQEYFNTQGLEKINSSIEKNWLNLDINKFLSTYMNYIENNLIWLDEKIKQKIIKSISNKLKELQDIINQRIAWVDEEIEEWDEKPENRQKEIRNQRWIINSSLQDLFSDINEKILPSAYILAKDIDLSELYSKGSSGRNGSRGYKAKMILSEINDMFNAEVLDNWDFDKTWTSWELIDANTNSWSTIDMNDDEQVEFLNKNWVNNIEFASMLNEKDLEIESEAFIAYMIYVASMVIPYAWVLTALPADTVDLFSDNEWISTMLRSTWIIDEDYRMEKWYMDTLLWWASIVLSVFWLQSIAKWWKIVKAWSLLEKIGVGKLERLLNVVWNRMWISNERLTAIKDILSSKTSNGLEKASWLKDSIKVKASKVVNKVKKTETAMEAESDVYSINKSTWEIIENWKKLTLVKNKSFYIEATNGSHYRIVTWKNWEITDVFNVTKNNKSLELWVEKAIYWPAQWALIKKNIKNIRKNYSEISSVKPKNINNTETISEKVTKNENITEVITGLSKSENNIFMKLTQTKLNKDGKISFNLKDWSNYSLEINAKNQYILNGESAKPFTKKEAYKRIPDEIKSNYLSWATNSNFEKLDDKPFKIKWWIEIITNNKTWKKEIFKNWNQVTDKVEIDKIFKEPEVIKRLAEKITSKVNTDNFVKELSKSKDLLKSIDEKLSKLPLFMNKPYTFSKWAVYNSEKWNFRAPISTTVDAIKTPYTTYKNIKESSTIWEYTKSILFAEKDISIKKWVLKVWWLIIAPTIIEEIINNSTIDNYEIDVSRTDVLLNYWSYMYLWILNSLILEYAFGNNNEENKEEESKK